MLKFSLNIFQMLGVSLVVSPRNFSFHCKKTCILDNYDVSEFTSTVNTNNTDCIVLDDSV